MSKVVSINDIVPLIKEQINRERCVQFTPRGNSMLPALRNNKDSVILEKPEFPLKKYDIAFYMRSSGKYVLHRVVKVEKDGTYVMRGDNQFQNESGLREDQIIGVVKKIIRKGKEYKGNKLPHKIYCAIWCNTVTVRKLLRKLRIILGRMKRKILGLYE